MASSRMTVARPSPPLAQLWVVVVIAPVAAAVAVAEATVIAVAVVQPP